MTLFFGLFALVGLLATGAVGVGFVQSLRPYFWKATPCTIVKSERATDGLEKASTASGPVVIRYRYEAGGRTHESEQLERGMKQTLNTKEIERLLFRYQAGMDALCYVNSNKPEEAVLRRGSLWLGLIILMPLLFLAVGVGGVFGIWWGESWRRRTATRGANSKAIGVVGMLLFFGLFLLVGGILTYFVAVGPMLKSFAAKNWPETPCEIVSSSVGSHSGSKGGTTYSIDIKYRYQVRGRDFQSDTYSLATGSSSGRGGKEQVVARYPVGLKSVCYVNPEDPTDALLSRELSPLLLIGLIPGLFFLVGLVGVVSTLKSLVKGVLARSTTPVLPGAAGVAPVIPLPITPAMVGPAELKPQHSPLAKLAGAMVLTLFWNGITGVFVWEVVSSFTAGKPQWFLVLFLTPFVLIGIGFVVMVGSTFLNLFNPRMRLKVNAAAIPLGGKLDVSWTFTSSSDRIKRLQMSVQGRAQTTQGSGKHRRTSTDLLVTVPVIDTTDPLQIAQGRGSVELPIACEPTGEEGNRKVVWILKAAGEIPRYPDFEEEYEVTVLARDTR